MKPGLAVLLEPVDPLTLVPGMGMGGLAGYAEAFGEFRDAVVVQFVVFEESTSLFGHGNTSPGHGHYLLAEGSVTHVLRQRVTYVLRIFCNLCLGPVQSGSIQCTNRCQGRG